MQVITCIHKILRPFMLRRAKSDLAQKLPDKIEMNVMLGMSQLQVKLYREILTMRGIFTTNDGAGGSGKVHLKSLHNVLMQIRKLINHPYMLDGVEDFSTQNEFGEHLVENSPKL